MAYLKYFLGTVLLLLTIVGTLNFFVDPAKIYKNTDLYARAYANSLIASQTGLFLPGNSFEERSLIKELARHSKGVDCVVIGSSHIMQLSSIGTRKALPQICSSILNLGVSGASIEDHITLSYLSSQYGPPNKVILGIDPWTFAFNKDPRWVAYEGDYHKALTHIFNAKLKSSFKNEWAKAKNLFNQEYTIRSLETLKKLIRDGFPYTKELGNVDPSVGGGEDARLKDGSYVYSSKYISDAKKLVIPIGGDPYKTTGNLNNDKAIQAYRVLLGWLKQQGIEPVLMLAPYHENVWKAQNSPNVQAMKATETIVQKLAQDLRIQLIGSYNPLISGCISGEFYDFMHPTTDCLVKLKPR